MAIVAVGLVAAAGAGVAGYRSVGLYGDGAFAGGFHREVDPSTGASILIREGQSQYGKIRQVIDKNYDITRVEVEGAGDGPPSTSVTVENGKVAGVGFSIVGDGVIDAWAYRDKTGNLTRIEVSTKRNGKIDRWERYSGGQMVRVDLDTDGDGRPDRWQTYEDGILMATFIDKNEDGRPDGPPIR